MDMQTCRKVVDAYREACSCFTDAKLFRKIAAFVSRTFAFLVSFTSSSTIRF